MAKRRGRPRKELVPIYASDLVVQNTVNTVPSVGSTVPLNQSMTTVPLPQPRPDPQPSSVPKLPEAPVRSIEPPIVAMADPKEKENGVKTCMQQPTTADSTKAVAEEVSNPPKQWNSLFQSNRLAANGMSLEYIPPMLVNGKPVGQLVKEEVEEEEVKWKNALVVFVLGNSPGFNGMKRFINLHWSHVPDPELFYHEEGYYIVKFNCIEDAKEILCGGPYTIANRPMILKQWSADFDFKAAFPTEIPLWIKFPNLPMSCWGSKSLSRIASVLGKPIYADECTAKQARISYARMLIEVNVSKQLPSEIEILDPNGRSFIQDVLYEWKPLFCEKCLEVGHNCLTKASQPTQKAKITQEWRVKAPTTTIQNNQEPHIQSQVASKETIIKLPTEVKDRQKQVVQDSPVFNITNFPPLSPIVMSNRFEIGSDRWDDHPQDEGGTSKTQ